jgi:signal transduction histidine kinase/CheY-like chemotaxis protein
MASPESEEHEPERRRLPSSRASRLWWSRLALGAGVVAAGGGALDLLLLGPSAPAALLIGLRAAAALLLGGVAWQARVAGVRQGRRLSAALAAQLLWVLPLPLLRPTSVCEQGGLMGLLIVSWCALPTPWGFRRHASWMAAVAYVALTAALHALDGRGHLADVIGACAAVAAAALIAPLASQEFDRLRRRITAAHRARSQAEGELRQRSERSVELERASARALAASQAKSVFLASMSHELRTPLNAVIGMATLLERSPMAAEQHDLIGTIRTSGNALLSLINDILDYSKIEAGKIELNWAPVPLRRLLDEALDIVAPAALARSLELTVQIDPAVPERVRSDEARLQQILVNLLSNAIKFTREGEVWVEVGWQERQNGTGRLSISVNDTGIGIAPDKVALLFQRFSQIDAVSAQDAGGTGLGLAISKALAQAMGGEIAVASTPGLGTEFCLELPAERAERAPKERLPLDGRVALVIEAHARSSAAAVAFLRDEGLATHCAQTLPEALGILGGRAVDVVYAREEALVAHAGSLAIWFDQLAHRGLEPPRLLVASLPGRAEPSALRQAGRAFRTATIVPVPWPTRHGVWRRALRAAFDAEPQEPERASDVRSIRTGLRVLVAEDDPVNQRVVRLMLQYLGHEVEVVSNGALALERIAEQVFDVALLDIQMPALDGLETARQLARWPADSRPHLIALTANALPGDRERCLDAGMAGYLSKPVALEALDEELRLARRRPRHEPATALDAQIVEQLRELGARSAPGLLADLVSLFYQANTERLGLLRDALGREDAYTAQRLVHAMKGSCSQMGAEAVVELLDGELPRGAAILAWATEIERRLTAARDSLQEAFGAHEEEPTSGQVIPLRKAR